MKVDVEVAELEVLQVMQNTLNVIRPVLLIEVTHRHAEVLRLLNNARYGVFDEDLIPIQDTRNVEGNIFAVPVERVGDIGENREAR
jgi:hypothetical protein